MKSLYGDYFYQTRHQKTHYSADTILTLLLAALPEIKSAADFGCGVGTWLSVLKEKGVPDIQGFDGPWVEQNLLQIPQENFRQINLEDPIQPERSYDLAISLEVAEHLPAEKAGDFIETLVNTADFVLFSAAIPYQGGKGHLNEQWQDYWAALFKAQGYEAVDFIRRQIWNDAGIPIWYRQNLLLYVKQARLKELQLTGESGNNFNFPQAIVHPETFTQMTTLKGSFRLFRRAVLSWMKLKFK
jgi:hypothetical protein